MTTKDDIKKEIVIPVLNKWGLEMEMEKIDYLSECVANTVNECKKYVKIYLFFDKKEKKLTDDFYVIPRDDRKKEYGIGILNADSIYIVALGNYKYGHKFNN